VLRLHVKDESVDLVYLDPPFNSNATYNVLFAEHGTRSAAQIKAFEDTWHWDESAAQAYQETVERGGDVAQALLAFRTLLGTSDMLAYLSMMAPRLVEFHRILKETGSVFLHCDPTASHYLKILLDAVFDKPNYRNEIIWFYPFAGRSKTTFSRKHDTIFWYSKSKNYIFNGNSKLVRIPITDRSTLHNYRYVDANGRKYREDPRKSGKTYRYYLDEGKIPEDVWTDIDSLHFELAERLGNPTQKPEKLLERIVAAASNEGDVILDPFCGCGTAIAVAQRLKRQWIGIDITHLAVNLIRHRLRDTYGDEIAKTYVVIGEPTTVEDAEQLAREDPYQFQWWALGLVGARPADQKKGADKGIDGRVYFHDEAAGGKTKQIILSVKAGKTGSAHVDQLRGVVEKEGAQIGVLISFQEPTKPMHVNAAGAGFYTSPGWNTSYPRVQLLTVRELLEGKGIEYPHVTGVTFKKAPKAEAAGPEAEPLPGLDSG